MAHLVRTRLDNALWPVLVTALLVPRAVAALPGTLDPSFGVSGVVDTAVCPADEEARAALLQPDGKLVVAGWTQGAVDRDVLLARYDAGGTLDASFGTGGIVTTDLGQGDDVVEGIALLSDGGIVVAGSAGNGSGSDILLLAYDASGVLESTFGAGGAVRTVVNGDDEALALLLDDDGKLVVAGRAGTQIVIARYGVNGALDSSFDHDGVRTTTAGTAAAATAIAQLSNENLVVAGWSEIGGSRDILLASYRPNGATVNGFGNAGLVIASLGGDEVAAALVGRPDDTLVVAGWSQDMSGTDVVLAGYLEDGDPDATFGTGGIVRTALGSAARVAALARDPDGNLLAAGWASVGDPAAFALLRYLPTGALDTSFGSGGAVTTPIGTGDAAAEAVVALADGRIVVAGRAADGGDGDVAVARYLGTPGCGNGIVEPEVGEACEDGDRANGDCCDAACQFDPVGSLCPDDGDPCTVESCDGNGACLHTAAAGVCDDRVCYRARSRQPFTAVSVALVDAFESEASVVRRPHALCPAASVDGAPLDDAALYQERYQSRTPPRARRTDVRMLDRFGTHRFRILGMNRLLVPTHVGVGSPPSGPPAAGSADALKCYRVRTAAAAPRFPDGVQVLAADEFGNRRYDVLGPHQLCLAAGLNGGGLTNPVGDLICYRLRLAAGEPTLPGVLDLHTANALGTGELVATRPDELCVRALREPCGVLPSCVPLGGQNADCSYDPAVLVPEHAFCTGPTVILDTSHGAFHTIENASGEAGRYWGFAKLLLGDGYDVQQTSEDTATVLARPDLDVYVTANPEGAGPSGNAIRQRDVVAIVDWVRAGGAFLLVIDHPPFERVGALLAAFGLERLGEARQRYVFTRASGTLNGAAVVANGPGPDTAVDSVETFTGTGFTISSSPPPDAQFESVLILPPELGGELQGVAISFGAGRVFVAGEAASLSAQRQADGDPMGMNAHPGNERYLRNILWWLTQ